MLILGSNMLFLPGMIMMMCVFVLLCGRRRISLTESAGSTWQTWQTLLWPWRSHSWISTTSHSTTSCSALVCADTWPIFVCVTCCAMVLEWKQKLFSYGRCDVTYTFLKSQNEAQSRTHRLPPSWQRLTPSAELPTNPKWILVTETCLPSWKLLILPELTS